MYVSDRKTNYIVHSTPFGYTGLHTRVILVISGRQSLYSAVNT